MPTTSKGTLMFGAFLFLIGLFFTFTAPGGLGEVTMVAGAALTLAANAPASLVRKYGTKQALYVGLVLTAVGAVLTVADWSDNAPGWIETAGGASFLGGVLVMTLYASAPKDSTAPKDSSARNDSRAPKDSSALSDAAEPGDRAEPNNPTGAPVSRQD